MIDSNDMVKSKNCPLQWLCEEVYPEDEMNERRQKCDDENCKWCSHYQDFYEGYFRSDD